MGNVAEFKFCECSERKPFSLATVWKRQESMDAEMSQGEPKRVCTDEMVAPWTEQLPNTL